MAVFAGLDVHSKQCTYVIQDEAGRTLGKGEISTTLVEIDAWVKQFKLDKHTTVAMETGLITPFVVRALHASGIENVKVINASEVRAKARRKKQKSDTSDAFEICDGIRRDIYVSIVHVPDEQTQRLRDKLSRRRHFVVAATREVNGIKSILRKAGLGSLYRALSSAKAFAKLLAEPQLDSELKVSIEAHQRVWTIVRAEVKTLDTELEAIAETMGEEVTRLQTVPGVGPIVSLTAVAFFSQPERFENAKHAASYTGLTPQMYNSADSERFGHITKQGPNELRAMLCEAAQHARKKGHPLHAIYQKLASKKGSKLAVIAVAHRLARILWAMMKNSSKFEVDRYAVKDSKWKELPQEEAETMQLTATH